MPQIQLKDMANAIRKGTIGKYMVALDRAIPKWQTEAQSQIKPMITDMIESGLSPVKSVGRYDRYSESYKKQIESSRKLTGKQRKGRLRKMGSYLNVMAANGKRVMPINLTVTGEMLRSIKSRSIKNGIAVWFTDKKAKYHDKLGAGKSKVIRKMLPSEGQEFSRVIEKQLTEILQSELNKQLQKN